MINKAIIIFSKLPVPGKVKTRLAKTWGNNESAKIYEVLARHTFNECLKLQDDVQLFLFYSDLKEEEQIKNWVDKKFILYHQTGDNLGERMGNAFKKVLNDEFKKVIIIGTDAPDISSILLKSALEKLNNFDYVIGPADDGGYYLLGSKQNDEEIFKEIDWSTNLVLKQTLKKIEQKDYKFSLLPALNDVDVEIDLLSWFKKNMNNKNHPLVKYLNNYKL